MGGIIKILKIRVVIRGGCGGGVGFDGGRFRRGFIYGASRRSSGLPRALGYSDGPACPLGEGVRLLLWVTGAASHLSSCEIVCFCIGSCLFWVGVMHLSPSSSSIDYQVRRNLLH